MQPLIAHLHFVARRRSPKRKKRRKKSARTAKNGERAGNASGTAWHTDGYADVPSCRVNHSVVDSLLTLEKKSSGLNLPNRKSRKRVVQSLPAELERNLPRGSDRRDLDPKREKNERNGPDRRKSGEIEAPIAAGKAGGFVPICPAGAS